jgi:hypothetical protein
VSTTHSPLSSLFLVLFIIFILSMKPVKYEDDGFPGTIFSEAVVFCKVQSLVCNSLLLMYLSLSVLVFDLL